MTDYPHIMSRIFNVPLMVCEAKLRVVVGGMAPQLGLVAVERRAFDVGPEPPRFPNVPGSRADMREYAVTDRGVAVIPVNGLMVHNSATAKPPSGMRAYPDIMRELADADRSSSVRRILFDWNSPGGEASDSAFQLAAMIRDVRTRKPVWGVADEAALSAAYLGIAQCERIFVPYSGYLGSIGTYAMLLDQTEYDRKQGLKWTFIQAGDFKTDGNPHVGASARLVAKLQADINETNERLLLNVGLGRPQLGVEGARALNADWFPGSQCVRLGLADGFGTFAQVLEAFSA